MQRELKQDLEEIVKHLNRSTDSAFAGKSVAELKAFAEGCLEKTINNENPDFDELKYFLAPTGALQETSIDNGWGEEFLRIAATIEKHIQL